MQAFLHIDIIIITSIFVVFLLASLKFRKSFLTTFIISFYPAYILFMHIEQVKNFDPGIKALAFFGLFATIFYVLEKYIIADYSYVTSHKYMQAIVLSASCTSLLLFMYYFIVPLTKYHNFGTAIDTLFTTKVPLIAWLSIPLVALFITNRD